MPAPIWTVGPSRPSASPEPIARVRRGISLAPVQTEPVEFPLQDGFDMRNAAARSVWRELPHHPGGNQGRDGTRTDDNRAPDCVAMGPGDHRARGRRSTWTSKSRKIAPTHPVGRSDDQGRRREPQQAATFAPPCRWSFLSSTAGLSIIFRWDWPLQTEDCCWDWKPLRRVPGSSRGGNTCPGGSRWCCAWCSACMGSHDRPKS